MKKHTVWLVSLKDATGHSEYKYKTLQEAANQLLRLLTIHAQNETLIILCTVRQVQP